MRIMDNEERGVAEAVVDQLHEGDDVESKEGRSYRSVATPKHLMSFSSLILTRDGERYEVLVTARRM